MLFAASLRTVWVLSVLGSLLLLVKYRGLMISALYGGSLGLVGDGVHQPSNFALMRFART